MSELTVRQLINHFCYAPIPVFRGGTFGFPEADIAEAGGYCVTWFDRSIRTARLDLLWMVFVTSVRFTVGGLGSGLISHLSRYGRLRA